MDIIGIGFAIASTIDIVCIACGAKAQCFPTKLDFLALSSKHITVGIHIETCLVLLWSSLPVDDAMSAQGSRASPGPAVSRK